jgi:exopolysaccharide biosynthesis protein
MPVNQKYYLSDTVSEDPTIRVDISTGVEEGVLYWIADIELQDASQLRTVAAEDFDSNGTEFGSVLARRMNAVLAVDGDYYCYVRSGTTVTIRQGIAYQDHWDRARQDVLVIDEDGDFHGITEPASLQGCTEINGKKIINAFCFGPLLVNNGKIGTRKAPYWVPDDQYSQRVAIAQTGHLKYRIIVTGPYRRGSRAFLFERWRRFVADMDDIQVAYNLDGGDSAVMVFNGEKINDPGNENERPLADIIYFASAWPGE